MSTSNEQRQLNQEMERKWRTGKISWTSFDWWLRWICDV